MVDLVDLDSIGLLDPGQLAEVESGGEVTVAYVHGRCDGAKLAMAVAVDLVVAGPDAIFGMPGAWTDVFVRRGVGICGRSLTKYLSMADRMIDAQRARSCGLVNLVTADPKATASALARQIGMRAPLAVHAIVSQAHRGARGDYVLSLTTDRG